MNTVAVKGTRQPFIFHRVVKPGLLKTTTLVSSFHVEIILYSILLIYIILYCWDGKMHQGIVFVMDLKKGVDTNLDSE